MQSSSCAKEEMKPAQDLNRWAIRPALLLAVRWKPLEAARVIFVK